MKKMIVYRGDYVDHIQLDEHWIPSDTSDTTRNLVDAGYRLRLRERVEGRVKEMWVLSDDDDQGGRDETDG